MFTSCRLPMLMLRYRGYPEALARWLMGTCKRSTWLQRIPATTDRQTDIQPDTSPYRQWSYGTLDGVDANIGGASKAPPLFPTTASPDHTSSLLSPACLPSRLQASGEPTHVTKRIQWTPPSQMPTNGSMPASRSPATPPLVLDQHSHNWRAAQCDQRT